MKRDLNLIYRILSSVEKGERLVNSTEEYNYQIKLLEDGGFIKVDKRMCAEISLTWDGHELLSILEYVRKQFSDLSGHSVEFFKSIMIADLLTPFPE